jgi:hypothetical protein
VLLGKLHELKLQLVLQDFQQIEQEILHEREQLQAR